MQLITEEYRKLNEQLHESNAGYGVNGYRHLDAIMMLANKLNTQDVLDYGCGKSRLAINMGFPINQYDPAIPKYSALPKPADLVTCTDVLEHIEPVYLDDVLDHLRGLTKKVLFAVIATRPAKKVLADGRNAHLIQKPVKWWMDRLWDRFDLYLLQVEEGEFHAVLLAK